MVIKLDFEDGGVGPALEKAAIALRTLAASAVQATDQSNACVNSVVTHGPVLLPAVRRGPRPATDKEIAILWSVDEPLYRRICVLSELTGLRPTKVTRYLCYGRGTAIVRQRISAAIAAHGVDLLSLVPRVHCKYCGEGDPTMFPSCAATDTETHTIEPDWGQPR